MNHENRINTDVVYEQAEFRARQYFKSLSVHMNNKTYVMGIMKDFQLWKKDHVDLLSSVFGRERDLLDRNSYDRYIQNLNYSGKLDRYLERSISYIFMRDLGKALYTEDTRSKVEKSVHRLKKQITKPSKEKETISMAGLYRWAQKEKVESTFIWLVDKLKKVRDQIPVELDADEAQRKLIKIIAGVVMHVIEEMDDELPGDERKRKLEEAIRLGYSYGLTYPFIDDLLDSGLLSMDEKVRYTELIRTTLTTGEVPVLGDWTGKNKNLIEYVHSELREAFTYIQSYQKESTTEQFYQDAYVFFESQEVDRNKTLENPHYTNEELYVPVIIKAASSRLIIRSIIRAEEDEGFDNRTFYYGLYNQLADDFADMFEDMEKQAVTPYTYYLTYYAERTDLINPFELYWTVIYYLIHHVYKSDSKTREVILSRAINGLKRFKNRLGNDKYKEVMDILTANFPAFNKKIQKMVKTAVDVDFFDKLLRDQIKDQLKQERQEREDFLEVSRTVREMLNDQLFMEDDRISPSDSISDAVRYSLEGEGKRLRPIVAWMMAIYAYGLEEETIIPLLKALEYMHTASLIFDDLPSQDDASMRRGKATLHEVYDVATAELTGLYLTQKAVMEQTLLTHFDSEKVIQLMNYSSRVIADMCQGQALDLESKGKSLTLEELNTMCFYKTGMAFEASIIMPAILAGVNEWEIEQLKKFAYHGGIAFQIMDDLLDASGDGAILGKPVQMDVENNNSTFVTVLGEMGAKKEMWNHYSSGLEALNGIQGNKRFLKHVLNYFVHRDH